MTLTEKTERVRIKAPGSTFHGLRGTIVQHYLDERGRPRLGVRMDTNLFAVPPMAFWPDEVEVLEDALDAMPGTWTLARGG